MDSYTIEIHNPHGSAPLQLQVTSNVSLDDINRNVAVNSAQGFAWFEARDAFTPNAIVVGGGPSMKDHIQEIDELAQDGVVIAVNGASGFLSTHGIKVDYQVIIDARPENLDLIDPNADNYLFASQCDPSLFAYVPEARVELVHLNSPGIEDHLPPKRRAAGGYTLIGGAGSVGNSALCLAHALGHRQLHVFGFDSSVDGADRHAYPQAMNNDEQLIMMQFGNRAYWLSYTMAVQYEHFFLIEAELAKMGTTIEVYGDGILPARWRRSKEVDRMSEADKYEYIWTHSQYGVNSPAERMVDLIDMWLPNGSEVLDLGCGVGRAAVELTKRGHTVTLIDFVDNSRCDDARLLPFIKADLAQDVPATAPYGYCVDVMEHIPPEQVRDVIRNIANATEQCLFRIEFSLDGFGPALLGTQLHLSVHDADWWREELSVWFRKVDYKGNGVFIAKH